MCRRERWLVR
ncbi:uncharacterized protein CELE_C13G3.12 [Caenorhabditis elegans]|uniref:Uncharacterized protein n=1 Tax=Caenorhabditis elegans TaxID=6239 RepID=A0A2K5ATW4_CAEEL|nr:Uncharacterized protein CELE_C13G3.12 [Caenorhabditis elegans]SPC47957.1 Uncharacterized protein CELE_C13G3.12 [Caenorhabditis elegans]|eukprot:NP_001348768.1 Uncharacterized protein CELE_C13G3.12 [Caenorhabditis elegans]